MFKYNFINFNKLIFIKFNRYNIHYNNNIPILLKRKIDFNNYSFGVLDIETFNYNNILLPYSIGFKIKKSPKKIINKYYYIGNFYIKNNLKLSSFNMIKKCLNDILLFNNYKKIYLYSHNLGAFDGYLLFNIILNIDSNVKFILDNNSHFIEIKFKNIIIKDSYRILPTSLLNLTKLVPNCLPKLEFDNTKITKLFILKNLNNNKFILNYIERYINSLYFIIEYYCIFFYINYNINFLKLYSASNMAMVIFRTNFYNEKLNPIPIINLHLYKLIKSSYYGGNIILNKNYGTNLYYYDINSLYPYAMLNKMPGKYIKYLKNLTTDIFLNKDLFGFYYCTILIPKYKDNIIISRDINNNIYYPKDKVNGLYFSEEIKNYIKLGYYVNVTSGYEFSVINNLFNNYVNHFYNLKSNANKEEKFLYKLMLNGLYGYLGRYPILNKSEIVNYEESIKISTYYEINKYLHLKENKCLINYEKKLKNKLSSNVLELFIDNEYKNKKSFEKVYSNIAITSAITSYARIHMLNFINFKDLYYSDTDSIITNKPLNNKYISSNIGDFKLEAHIKELIILNNKVYAYIDYNNNVIIKSAGIPINLLSYKDFKEIYFDNKYKIINFNKIFSNINEFNLISKNYNIRLKKEIK